MRRWRKRAVLIGDARFSLDVNLAAGGRPPELHHCLGDGPCSPGAPKAYAHLIEVGVEQLVERNQRHLFRRPRLCEPLAGGQSHFLPFPVVPPVQFIQLRCMLPAYLPRLLAQPLQ